MLVVRDHVIVKVLTSPAYSSQEDSQWVDGIRQFLGGLTLAYVRWSEVARSERKYPLAFNRFMSSRLQRPAREFQSKLAVDFVDGIYCVVELSVIRGYDGHFLARRYG